MSAGDVWLRIVFPLALCATAAVVAVVHVALVWRWGRFPLVDMTPFYPVTRRSESPRVFAFVAAANTIWGLVMLGIAAFFVVLVLRGETAPR